MTPELVFTTVAIACAFAAGSLLGGVAGAWFTVRVVARNVAEIRDVAVAPYLPAPEKTEEPKRADRPKRRKA